MFKMLCSYILTLYVAGENAGESVVQRISIHSGPTTSAEKNTSNTFSFQGIKVERSAIANAPPTPPPPLYQAPPAFFTGYSLPPGNPCETFALPPPPADKKRTGPRRKFYLSHFYAFSSFLQKTDDSSLPCALIACPVCYLPLEEAVALMPKAPSFSPMLKSLTYNHEESLTESEFGGSEFGGYPSLRQRDDSYIIRDSMSVHCGYDSYLSVVYSECFRLYWFFSSNLCTGKENLLMNFVFPKFCKGLLEE